MRPLDLNRDIVARVDKRFHPSAELLKVGGVTAVLADAPEAKFAEDCQAQGIGVYPAAEVPCSGLMKLPGTGACALDDGIWPGIGHAGKSDDPDALASASQQPWLDANGFRIAHLKALFPERPAVLAYEPNEKAGVKPERLLPYSSLELALVEAWVWGGNFLLAVDGDFSKALEKQDPKAVAAWKELGKTSRWLVEHRPLFQLPAIPALTTLVEMTEETGEIANLQVRNNAAPAVCPLARPPRPDARRVLVVVAVNLTEKTKPTTAGLILEHARAGATIVVDEPGDGAWWRVPGLKKAKAEADRVSYTLGAGKVIAYNERIADPSEFALDSIDFVGQGNRAVRFWAAPTVLGRAVITRRGAAMIAVNYGQPVDVEIQARIRGIYRSATLIRPDGAPLKLKTAKRGSTTEVQIPELRKLGVVLFE